MAPTMLDLVGVPTPRTHGHSLRNPKRRDDFLIEYSSDTVFKRVHKMGYRAIRNSRWKYIEYGELKGANELYDLRKDPFELHNLIGAAKMQSTLKNLQSRLSELASQIDPV
jgi:arylsulfatase A-like enzyme